MLFFLLFSWRLTLLPTPSHAQRSVGGTRHDISERILRCMHSPRSCGETLGCSPASGEVVPQEPAQHCQHRPVSSWWTRWCDVGLPVASWRYPVTTVLRVKMERIHHRRNHDSKPRPTKSRDLLHLKLKLPESDWSTNTEGTRSGSRVPHCERRGVGALADHLRRGAFPQETISVRYRRTHEAFIFTHAQLHFVFHTHAHVNP